jgi:hypothetical protein
VRETEREKRGECREWRGVGRRGGREKGEGGDEKSGGEEGEGGAGRRALHE